MRAELSGHLIETAYERAWSNLSNGDLLAAAEVATFELFLTTDQNLRHQQNLRVRRIAILVLPTTRWPEIRHHIAEIASAISLIRPGELREVSW